MKVAALLSGGKDSCYNMLECVRHGHEITCLVNLLPADESINELDSFMYQTVGHNAIDAIAEAMDLPLIRVKITGKCIESELKYTPHEGDEVEDLYVALKQVKEQYPDVEGVSAGAILSNYQRERVENVCHRLGLISLAYLWRREQRGLLGDMVDSGIDAILIKTATIGLNQRDIGKSILQLYSKLCKSEEIYGCNPCGEGGEYETFTLDAPIYKKRIVIDDASIICHSYDRDAPVYLYVPNKWHLEDKERQVVEVQESLPIVHPSLTSQEYLMNWNCIEELGEVYSLTNLQNLEKTTAIEIVTNTTDFKQYLTDFTNPPSLRVVYSSACKHPIVRTFSQHDVRNQTWYSRSVWCPGALYGYSLISSTSYAFSIPMILPLESDSLHYTSASTEDAYSLCKEYQEKLVSIVARKTKVISSYLFLNECYSLDQFPYRSENCMIVGTVSSVEKDCSMQYGCRGVLLNDDDEETEVEEKDYYCYKLGENVKYELFCNPSMEEIKIQTGFSNTTLTMYVDPESLSDLEGQKNFIHKEHPMIIPVAKLGRVRKSGIVERFPIIVEVTSFN